MLPPSATLGVAVRLTVVVSSVSVMLVVAATGLTTRFSKLPPVADAIVAETEPASRYTSSPGAAILAVPDEAPAAIMMTLPLESVTVTGDWAALLRLAV